MKFEKTEVFNFEGALRGMRNPKESWALSDSYYGCVNGSESHFTSIPTKCQDCLYSMECNNKNKEYNVGEKDFKLARTLIQAGSEHRKFLRQIMLTVDITAPLYFWKEFDTYKVGTTANSTSCMHKLASTPINIGCFEMSDFCDILIDPEHLTNNESSINLIKVKTTASAEWFHLIDYLETLRKKYMETKDKSYWKELIRMLPSSWLQTRTVTMNYENVLTMYHQRKNHKLTEWSVDFINWCDSLPYFKEMCLK